MRRLSIVIYYMLKYLTLSLCKTAYLNFSRHPPCNNLRTHPAILKNMEIILEEC